MERPRILLLPGASDNIKRISRNSMGLVEAGFDVRVMSGNWLNPQESLEQKIRRVRHEMRFRGFKAAIGVDTSASLVFAAGHDLEEMYALVNVAGSLRRGVNNTSVLEEEARKNPVVREAVVHFESQIYPYLTAEQKDHMLTMRGIYDRVVPPNSTILEGATNVELSSSRWNPINHRTNIRRALRSDKLEAFLKLRLS